ncbi:MAG: hypothetical protein ABR949_04120 [Candidatus Aquilonibacter sp.]
MRAVANNDGICIFSLGEPSAVETKLFGKDPRRFVQDRLPVENGDQSSNFAFQMSKFVRSETNAGMDPMRHSVHEL